MIRPQGLIINTKQNVLKDKKVLTYLNTAAAIYISTILQASLIL